MWKSATLTLVQTRLTPTCRMSGRDDGRPRMQLQANPRMWYFIVVTVLFKQIASRRGSAPFAHL